MYGGKKGNRHYSQNFDISAIKISYLNALLSFLLLLPSQLDPKPSVLTELSLLVFLFFDSREETQKAITETHLNRGEKRDDNRKDNHDKTLR